MINGTVLGYDPGGDGTHGVSRLTVTNGRIIAAASATLATLQEAVEFAEHTRDVVAVGVDTLSCWATGASGWRPADTWLRQQYPEVRSSVVSPNGLYGAMCVNGMAFLLAIRTKFPSAHLSETHPKVLYWALTRSQYNFQNERDSMNSMLSNLLRISVAPNTEHEWDALISAGAALHGLSGEWAQDLHSLPVPNGVGLLHPVGATGFYWPPQHAS